MATFYLVRHGQTDYSERNKKIYQGFGVNLSPLSTDGVKEIINTSKDKRLCEACVILSSPYTRAVQTAAILSKELQIDISIETDLHEWMANKIMSMKTTQKQKIIIVSLLSLRAHILLIVIGIGRICAQ